MKIGEEFPRFFPEVGLWVSIKLGESLNKTSVCLCNYRINVMVRIALNLQLCVTGPKSASPPFRPLLDTHNPFVKPSLNFIFSIRLHFDLVSERKTKLGFQRHT